MVLSLWWTASRWRCSNEDDHHGGVAFYVSIKHRDKLRGHKISVLVHIPEIHLGDADNTPI